MLRLLLAIKAEKFQMYEASSRKKKKLEINQEGLKKGENNILG